MASVIKQSKSQKIKNDVCSSGELSTYSKEELMARVQQLEAHVYQLKNIIKKQTGGNKAKGSQRVKKGRPFDFSKHRTRHVLIHILYLGWNYQGYAVQDDSPQTIEHHIFEALQRSCLIPDRESSNYHRCGRTDKGVSAFSQMISIDIRSCLTPETEHELSKELPYCKMLNRLLPEEIRAVAWSAAPCSTTSARFDCTSRSYHYVFPRGTLNIAAMQQAASYLVGSYDFRNLCKMDVGNGVVDFRRSIFEAHVQVINAESRKFKPSKQENLESEEEKMRLDNQCTAEKSSNCEDVKDKNQMCETCKKQSDAVCLCHQSNPYDFCELVVTGKAFLWHQIRCIASVLFLVGNGHENPEVVKTLLDPEKCPSKPQYSLALELPLCLFECNYDLPLTWFYDQEELQRLIRDLQKRWTSLSIKSEITRQMLHVLETKVTTPVNRQSDSLIQGVQPKVYQPLLQRDTCSSLENRIEHYVKRRKLQVISNESSATSEMSSEKN